MATFFSDIFGVDPVLLEEYGAFDVSLITDLPLFIDPFLLFNSEDAEYRRLHDDIIAYLRFLKDKATAGPMPDGLLRQWYCFKEVKQTWLGFSEMNNDGRGLGIDFARSLHGSLKEIFSEFGSERITRGSHLEKVCLIKDGVGRDSISDFTTNLIKEYLYEFTERFALEHIEPEQRKRVSIPRVKFNFKTETWSSRIFSLPWFEGDHVVLTPKDMLTRDENWINRGDLVRGFEAIPVAIPDQDLRQQVENYFSKELSRSEADEPSAKERADAAIHTIFKFPELIDYYIKSKEDRGDDAQKVSEERVQIARFVFDAQIRHLQNLLGTSQFYGAPVTSFDETLKRALFLKDVVENKGGHRYFYNAVGDPVRREEDLQVMFRLVWYGSPLVITREANDGRGPADFKISRSSTDTTIVEMKLAKNTQLKKNLQKQAEIYQAASDADRAIKVILFFTEDEEARVIAILKELGLTNAENVILIDARTDNKPSGSKA